MPINREFLVYLGEIVGSRFSIESEDLKKKSSTLFAYKDKYPDVIVKPVNQEEIKKIILLCSKYSIPVVPYGSGTSVEGQIVHLFGGLCMDFSEMNKIIELSESDMYVTVQPGISYNDLNNALEKMGINLFFPIDAGPGASIGGMVNTRASGTNAIFYGTMLNNVLGLEVVLADGRCIKTGSKTVKSSAGYDLTRLIIGSEGTLGIVSSVTLKLQPKPAFACTAVCQFLDLKSAVESVIKIKSLGITPGRIELLDEVQMDACIRYSHIKLDEYPTLLIEFHGISKAQIQAEIDVVDGVLNLQKTKLYKILFEKSEQDEIWKARKSACHSVMALAPHKKIIATDVCVPISKLEECILSSKRSSEKYGLIAPIVGHVGDGNFHLSILVNMDDEDELGRALKLSQEVVEHALRLGGTCTGEHGIGIGKQEHLINEYGSDAIDLMKTLKLAMDPKNILNPGKIFNNDKKNARTLNLKRA